MKKLAVFALAALFAVGASAQETLKQVKKLKDYNEAAKLVKANEANMQPEEAAQCYNLLVKLSVDKVTKEIGNMTENQMAAQMGKKPVEIDSAGLYKAVYDAIMDAQSCDKYDQMPNAKGKVPNKFRKANAETLYAYRPHLINGGILYQSSDPKLFFKYLAAYVDSYEYSVFSEVRKPDENLTQIAYYAAIAAYQGQDFETAVKYAGMAEKDPEFSKEATNIKVQAASQGLKTREDSLKYVTKLEALYAEKPEDANVFSQLTAMYQNLDLKDKAAKLIDERIAKNPNDYSALVMRGQAYYDNKEWDKALADFENASAQMPDYVPLIAFIGNCYANRADQAYEKAAGKSGYVPVNAQKVINQEYEKAIEFYQKAKEKDTTGEFKRYYSYPLYNCCYRVYGEDDPRTQAAKPQQ